MRPAHPAGGAARTETSRDHSLLVDGPVRRAILTLAARARADWGFATTILATGFREARLGQNERRLVECDPRDAFRFESLDQFTVEWGDSL